MLFSTSDKIWNDTEIYAILHPPNKLQAVMYHIAMLLNKLTVLGTLPLKSVYTTPSYVSTKSRKNNSTTSNQWIIIKCLVQPDSDILIKPKFVLHLTLMYD